MYLGKNSLLCTVNCDLREYSRPRHTPTPATNAPAINSASVPGSGTGATTAELGGAAISPATANIDPRRPIFRLDPLGRA